VAKKAEYQAWILSHTPEEIHAANLARRQLRRLTKDSQKTAPKHTTMLIDDRKVKAVANPYAQFFGERYRSGDLKGLAVKDASRLVASEWKALTAAEKKVCCDFHLALHCAHTTTEIRRPDRTGQG